jgi:hypothetical protein
VPEWATGKARNGQAPDLSRLSAERPNYALNRANLLRVWHGKYQCYQGDTAVDVTLTDMTEGYVLSGTFSFFNLPGMSNAQPGSYSVTGKFDPLANTLVIDPVGWINRPAGYTMIGFTVSPNSDWTRFDGNIRGPGCTTITLHKW